MIDTLLTFPDMRVFDILDFNTPATVEGIDTVISKVKDRFNLLHVTYRCHTFPGCDIFHPFLRTDYAPEWVEHYKDNKYIEIDPVALLAAHSKGVVDITDLPLASKRDRKMRNEAGDFGIGSAGVTIPVRGSDRQYNALFTVTTNDSIEGWKKRRGALTSTMRLVADFVHMKASDIYIRREIVDYDVITVAEREALSWIADGKDIMDIGTSMKVSLTEVTDYLDAAVRKLGALNYTHAVSKAIRAGLVS